MATVLNAYLNHDMFRRFGNAGFTDVFLPIYAVVIFAVVRYLCTVLKMPSFLEKTVCFLGSGVSGTYLFEKQLRELLYPVFEWMDPRIHIYREDVFDAMRHRRRNLGNEILFFEFV